MSGGLKWQYIAIIATFSSSIFFLSPPLDNIRVMAIVWRLRGNIIRTALCWTVWHSVHTPQHTYVSSSYRSNRLGLSHWDPYVMHSGSWIELCYCNMVEWFWWDSSWSQRPTGFLQCFDTVRLVICLVKFVPEMTYNVLSGTLSIYTITYSIVERQTIFRSYPQKNTSNLDCPSPMASCTQFHMPHALAKLQRSTSAGSPSPSTHGQWRHKCLRRKRPNHLPRKNK